MQSTQKDMICDQACLASVANGMPVQGITANRTQYGLPAVQVHTLIGSDIFPGIQPVFGRKPLMTVSSLRVERPSRPFFVDGM